MRALPRKIQAGPGFSLQSFFAEIQGKKGFTLQSLTLLIVTAKYYMDNATFILKYIKINFIKLNSLVYLY